MRAPIAQADPRTACQMDSVAMARFVSQECRFFCGSNKSSPSLAHLFRPSRSASFEAHSGIQADPTLLSKREFTPGNRPTLARFIYNFAGLSFPVAGPKCICR